MLIPVLILIIFLVCIYYQPEKDEKIFSYFLYLKKYKQEKREKMIQK
ncbi:MAG: hypothetical protein ACOCZT_01000 [Halanaerobiales bacterium]